MIRFAVALIAVALALAASAARAHDHPGGPAEIVVVPPGQPLVRTLPPPGNRPASVSLRLARVRPPTLDDGSTVMLSIRVREPGGDASKEIGLLDFFGAGEDGHHATKSFDLPLDEAIAELGLRPSDPVEFVFEPASGVEDEAGASESRSDADRPEVRMWRAEVVAE